MAGAGQRGPLIAGALAPGFRLFFPATAGVEAKPDAWIANNLAYDRGPAGARVIARLKSGVGLKRAQQQVEVAAADLEKSLPGAGAHIRLEPMLGHMVTAVRP